MEKYLDQILNNNPDNKIKDKLIKYFDIKDNVFKDTYSLITNSNLYQLKEMIKIIHNNDYLDRHYHDKYIYYCILVAIASHQFAKFKYILKYLNPKLIPSLLDYFTEDNFEKYIHYLKKYQ